MDMMGLGAIARAAMTGVARAIGEELAQKTLVNLTPRNIGKSATQLLEEVLQKTLCRTNSGLPTPTCVIVMAAEEVTETGSVAVAQNQFVHLMRGEAVIAARAEISKWPKEVLPVKEAAKVAAKSIETVIQKTMNADKATGFLAEMLETAAKKAPK
jgi:hypothetical protein